MRRWQAFFSLCVLLVIPVCGANAATFRDLAVIEDGSAVPPGDVLQVKMTLYPQDRELKYEIRAYVIPVEMAAPAPPAPDNANGEAPDPEPQLVLTNNEQVRDPEGHYLQVVTMPCPEQTVAYQESFTVAYSDLALAVGVYSLGYEVRVYRGEDLQFSCATPLEKMEITAEPREMRQRIPKVEFSTENREQTFLQDGQLVTEVQPETITTDSFSEGDFVVAVPGGYRRRKEYFAAAPADNASPQENCALAVNMGHQPWNLVQSPPIYFATNRKVNPQAPIKERFTAEEDDHLTCGTMQVNLPLKANHTPGHAEVPQHFWTRLDPQKHFFLEEATNTLTEDELLNVMVHSIESQENDLLIFIHGFDNSFEDAALRIAQLRLDSHFPGQALLWSWASLGEPDKASYDSDEDRAVRAIPLFAAFLRRLASERSRQPNPGDIHLIAHSMGNRVLLGVLNELAADPAFAGTQPLGHIVFAAADEEAATLQLEVQNTSRLSRSRTLYYCMDDWALRISQGFHQNVNRAGQVGRVDNHANQIMAEAKCRKAMKLRAVFS